MCTWSISRAPVCVISACRHRIANTHICLVLVDDSSTAVFNGFGLFVHWTFGYFIADMIKEFVC